LLNRFSTATIIDDHGDEDGGTLELFGREDEMDNEIERESI
jgi:hypothetical protein